MNIDNKTSLWVVCLTILFFVIIGSICLNNPSTSIPVSPTDTIQFDGSIYVESYLEAAYGSKIKVFHDSIIFAKIPNETNLYLVSGNIKKDNGWGDMIEETFEAKIFWDGSSFVKDNERDFKMVDLQLSDGLQYHNPTGNFFTAVTPNTLSSPQHYTDKFTTDGVQSVFPLSHKFIPNTLKVYFTESKESILRNTANLDSIRQEGLDKFRQSLTSEEKEGISWKVGSDKKSIILTSPDKQCAFSNADKGCLTGGNNCPCPELPYESGWDIEAIYDGLSSSEEQANTKDVGNNSNDNVQSTQDVPKDKQEVEPKESFKVNVSNSQGGVTVITITKVRGGYIGQKGETYFHYPTIKELQAVYNVNEDSKGAVQSTQAVDLTDSYTINVPNSHGGYTAIIIKKSGGGYVGLQGEYYSEFPRVSQLRAVYGIK
jgi:hypothetical protein